MKAGDHKVKNRSKLWIRGIAIFLSLSYAIGAPYTMVLEYRDQLLSQRFGYPEEFIYFICAVQFFCAIGLLIWPLVRWAAAILTVITLGAIYSHFKIESPSTAIPALFYTVLQIWVGLNSQQFAEKKVK